MPFVPVKCTSCGGEIQLDDQKEHGFCAYCGSKVVFKEAEQKMKLELSGSISVDGIATLERLLKNAKTFRELNDVAAAKKTLHEIINRYPEDYRAWWELALDVMDRGANYDFDIFESPLLIYIKNTIKLAPEDKLEAIKKRCIEWFESLREVYIKGYSWEKEEMQAEIDDSHNKIKEYQNKVQEYKSNKTKAKMAQIKMVLLRALLMIALPVIALIVFNQMALIHPTPWLLLIIPITIYIMKKTWSGLTDKIDSHGHQVWLLNNSIAENPGIIKSESTALENKSASLDRIGEQEQRVINEVQEWLNYLSG